jgi:hypothetical protein
MRWIVVGDLARPHQPAGAPVRLAAGVDRVARDLDRLDRLHAGDHLDLVAVGLLEPHPLAAARLVQGLDARGARQLGDPA